jgi:hypothetical protein
MQTICCNLAALAVAGIFYTWRTYFEKQGRRERTLRERVTYLLWVMAGQVQ